MTSKNPSEFNIRVGKGIKWRMIRHTCMGDQVSSGYTIDNLDTKDFNQAINKYEKVFILIRKALEEKSSHCMDIENERLACCQAITDILKKEKLI